MANAILDQKADEAEVILKIVINAQNHVHVNAVDPTNRVDVVVQHPPLPHHHHLEEQEEEKEVQVPLCPPHHLLLLHLQLMLVMNRHVEVVEASLKVL